MPSEFSFDPHGSRHAAEQGNTYSSLLQFVVAGSICLSPATLLWPFVFPDHLGYVLSNRVTAEFPGRLLPYFLASFLAVGAIYVHRFVRSRPLRLSTLVESTRRCNSALLILLACAPVAALAAPAIEKTAPFFTLLLIALVAAIGGTSGYLWTRPGPGAGLRAPLPQQPLIGLLVVATAAIGYSVALSHFSILNLNHFNFSSFDLAKYESVVWHTAHGDFLGSSFHKGGTHTSTHFDPLLAMLTPFYLLAPRAETLLVLQSVWLASGAIPLYLVAARVLRGTLGAVVVAGAFLLHPALHGINLYEFHSLALVVPLVIWLLYFLERDHAWGYWVTLGLILLTREDMALLSCGIGLFVALGLGRPRRGLLTISCALLYFMVVKSFVMPEPGIFMSGKSGDSYRTHFEQMMPFEGGGATEFLLTMLTNPVFSLSVALEEPKFLYLLLILLPCAFLPLFAGSRWLLLVYGLLFCLFSSKAGPHSIYKQYSSNLLPFVIVLAPYGLKAIAESRAAAALGLESRRLRTALLVSMAIAAVLVSWKFGALVENQTFRVGGWRRPIHFRTQEEVEKGQVRYEFLARVIEQIPATASVSATRFLVSHVSNREKVFIYPRGGDRADYLLVRPEILEGRGAEVFEARRRSSDFEVVTSGEGIVLLKALRTEPEQKAKRKGRGRRREGRDEARQGMSDRPEQP